MPQLRLPKAAAEAEVAERRRRRRRRWRRGGGGGGGGGDNPLFCDVKRVKHVKDAQVVIQYRKSLLIYETVKSGRSLLSQCC